MTRPAADDDRGETSMTDPKTRAARADDVLGTLGGSAEAAAGMAAYFETQGALGSIARLTGAGEVWSRDALSRRDRSLVVITFLAALGREWSCSSTWREG